MLAKFMITILTLSLFTACDQDFQEGPKIINQNEASTPSQGPSNDSDDTALPETSGAAIRSGSFIGRNGYDVSGDVEIFFDPVRDIYSIVLTDSFSSQAGPDLRVYLSQDSGVSLNASNLGVLTRNEGILRYDISASQYDASFSKVLIWCERFSVLFGEANI